MFDRQDGEGGLQHDPLATLEALRQHADRISLFCQAGQIAVPGDYRNLLIYLEDTVFRSRHPIRTISSIPKSGSFVIGPKLVICRFDCCALAGT